MWKRRKEGEAHRMSCLRTRFPPQPDDTMIDYRSDNTGRAAPEILDALVRANAGTALGYGADEWTAQLQERFCELFETRVRVFPVATGTAANALSLAAISPSWGLVYCSEAAHINTSEANAAGFFGGGLKLVPVSGNHGRIDPDALARMLAAIAPGQLHRGQDRNSTRLNSSHSQISYAVFCLKKKKNSTSHRRDTQLQKD